MDEDIKAALDAMGFAVPLGMEALAGGVSCDVYVAELPDGRRIVVKRALPKLRVAADWYAPAERAEAETAWIRMAAGIDPRFVPKVLGEDPVRHVFAMEFLPFPVWKSQLASGDVDTAFAAKVGAALKRLHVPVQGFDNKAQFHALRIEPYLLHTADRHLDVAPRIREIAASIEDARIAVMHGDFSPKNILVGPDPVILDAECACIGDPAFDLAFCLNHLLLKGVWRPEHAPQYDGAFTTLKDAYAPDAALDRRAASLLAAFLLARIDGKSPVEYLTDERQKDFVRAKAKALLAERLTLDETRAYFAISR